jgi:hypothetical protein
VVRHLLLAMCALSLGYDAPAAQKADGRAASLLAQVRSYVRTWQEQLLAIVAEEHYRQTRRVAGGGRGWRRVETRHMRSDLLLLRAPAGGTWTAFRDVIAVDGNSVRDRESRFDALFRAPSSQLATDAQRIADESARFNLGVTRNLNVPTAALVFLEDIYGESTSWSVDGHEDDHLVLAFEQRNAPFAISDQSGKGVPAEGRLWVEPSSGRITRTELRARARVANSRLRTRYGRAPGIDVFVPLEMEEESAAGGGDRTTGVASYRNHRVFQVHGRVIGSG